MHPGTTRNKRKKPRSLKESIRPRSKDIPSLNAFGPSQPTRLASPGTTGGGCLALCACNAVEGRFTILGARDTNNSELNKRIVLFGVEVKTEATGQMQRKEAEAKADKEDGRFRGTRRRQRQQPEAEDKASGCMQRQVAGVAQNNLQSRLTSNLYANNFCKMEACRSWAFRGGDGGSGDPSERPSVPPKHDGNPIWGRWCSHPSKIDMLDACNNTCFEQNLV